MSITLYDCTILNGREMRMQDRDPTLAGRMLIGGSIPVAGTISYILLLAGRSASTPVLVLPPAGAVVLRSVLIVFTVPVSPHPL
jgi:hypothetical protein